MIHVMWTQLLNFLYLVPQPLNPIYDELDTLAKITARSKLVTTHLLGELESQLVTTHLVGELESQT